MVCSGTREAIKCINQMLRPCIIIRWLCTQQEGGVLRNQEGNRGSYGIRSEPWTPRLAPDVGGSGFGLTPTLISPTV